MTMSDASTWITKKCATGKTAFKTIALMASQSMVIHLGIKGMGHNEELNIGDNNEGLIMEESMSGLMRFISPCCIPKARRDRTPCWTDQRFTQSFRRRLHDWGESRWNKTEKPGTERNSGNPSIESVAVEIGGDSRHERDLASSKRSPLPSLKSVKSIGRANDKGQQEDRLSQGRLEAINQSENLSKSSKHSKRDSTSDEHSINSVDRIPTYPPTSETSSLNEDAFIGDESFTSKPRTSSPSSSRSSRSRSNSPHYISV